ncbi:putative serpin-like protein, partial [Leptotrombidium deliense]
MTLLGARNETQKQMYQGLRYSRGFKSTDEVHSYFKELLDECEKADSCALNVANRVLIHKSEKFKVNPEYAKQLFDLYKAEVNEANFVTESKEIVKSCNDWVKNMTNGKIANILQSLNEDDRAVLINAIYFKGMWET